MRDLPGAGQQWRHVILFPKKRIKSGIHYRAVLVKYTVSRKTLFSRCVPVHWELAPKGVQTSRHMLHSRTKLCSIMGYTYSTETLLSCCVLTLRRQLTSVLSANSSVVNQRARTRPPCNHEANILLVLYISHTAETTRSCSPAR